MSSTGRSDFSVSIDGLAVPVRVTRHVRARRLKLRYDVIGGGLRLTMPWRGDLAAARRWTAEQEDWIHAQLTAAGSLRMVGPGSEIPFRGGHLRVDWHRDWPRTPQLVGDDLRLGGPVERVGPRVARWMALTALDRLDGASRAMADAASLKLLAVSVGDPRARWGSCTAAGALRYSWRLMMAPDFVVASVVAHEVAHLRHLNHSPAFHALARQLLGADPAPARAWLRTNGRALHHWRFDAV